MADNLRADLEAAMNEGAAETDTPPAEGAEAPSTAPSTPSESDRARDEQGRFTQRPVDPPAGTPAPAGGAAASPAGAPTQVQPPVERIAPPANWKGGAKTQWDKLPRPVQEELLAAHKTIGEAETSYGEIKSIIEPRALALQAEYGSVGAAIKQLFALSDFAQQNPMGFVQMFAQQRGLDLSQLARARQAGGQPQGTPPAQQVHPVVRQLASELASVKAQLQQNQSAPLEREIAAFRDDQANPYFEDVRQHMAILLETGAAKTLREAYDQAIWANPNIRAELQKDLEAKAAAERKRQVDAARSAASITGSPTPGVVSSDAAPTIRAELERQFAAAGGRV